MSAALLEGRYEDNVYGAVSFREADSNNGSFDYTLHVRQRVAPSYRICRRCRCCIFCRKSMRSSSWLIHHNLPSFVV